MAKSTAQRTSFQTVDAAPWKAGAARAPSSWKAGAARAPSSSKISGHVVGTVVGLTGSSPLVTYPNNPHGPLAARSTVVLPERHAAEPGEQAVLLVFEEERSDRPVIVGCVVEQPNVPSPALGRSQPLTARVDGARVVIDAQDEVVLQCGRASITLRRNGRVVIRGTYVETRAEGVNRIKGGSVQIN